MRHSIWVPWLLPLVLASCADLSVLPRDVCGNGIIEKGEDCDTAGIGESRCNEACRLECNDATCPAGWGCGNDGLCRQPTGAFEPFGATLPLSAEHLELADFDGDGRSDVLATRGSTFSIAYLDPSGLQSRTTNVSFAAPGAHGDVPAAGDIDADGRADLAFGLRDGLSVMHGRPDRSLTADSFSTRLDVPLAAGDVLIAADVDLRPEAPGEEIFALRADGLYLVRTANQADLPTGPLVTFPSGHGKLAGAVVAGYFTSGGAHYGVDLAFAFEGEDHVTFVKPLLLQTDANTVLTGTWNYDGATQPPVVVTLPAGAKVREGIALAPARGNDNYFDLLVSGEDDLGASTIFAAYAYTGGFSSSPLVAGTGIPDNVAVPFARLDESGGPAPAALAEAPLVMADVNGDEMVDFITPRGVFVSVCNLPPGCNLTNSVLPGVRYAARAAPDGAARWTSAVSTGARAFYLAADEAGLTFLRAQTTFGDFNTFRIPTQSPIAGMALGDFDGDGATDLAFTQTSSRAPSISSLHVAFGDALQIPQAPVDLGDLGAPSQVLSSRIQALQGYQDGVSDLLITAETEGESVLYRFEGSTDRQIQSPLRLTDPCDAGASAETLLGTPRATAFVRVQGRAELDVAALHEEPGGGYVLHSVDPRSRVGSAVCESKRSSALIDDAGSDELVMLGLDLDSDDQQDVVLLPRGTARVYGCKRLDAEWACAPTDLPRAHNGMAQVDLGPTNAGSTLVFWSDTALTVARVGVALAPVWSIDLADVRCADQPIGAVRGVSALNLDDDGDNELVVVTDQATLVFDTAGIYEGKPPPKPTCRDDALAGGGQAITTGDVDGDGVSDVVIARPFGLQIFTGKPVLR